MTPGRTLACSMWTALRLELPAKRKGHLHQFVAGLTMQPAAYTSLLRAMARAGIEAGVIPVEKSCAHDPVDLIASAAAAAIARWDREPFDNDAFSADLATRGAALRALYACECLRHEAHRLPRHALRTRAGMRDDDYLAELAERVVVGDRANTAAASDAVSVEGVPLAYALLMVRAQRFRDARATCEFILTRVPGHTVALLQAARCCRRLGDYQQARAYARRAAIRLDGTRTYATTAESG